MDSRSSFDLGVKLGTLRETLINAVISESEPAPGDIIEPALMALLEHLQSPSVKDLDLGIARSEEAVENVSYWLDKFSGGDELPNDLDWSQALHLLSDLEIYFPRVFHIDQRREQRIIIRRGGLEE
jgi:hypothetical protein